MEESNVKLGKVSAAATLTHALQVFLRRQDDLDKGHEFTNDHYRKLLHARDASREILEATLASLQADQIPIEDVSEIYTRGDAIRYYWEWLDVTGAMHKAGSWASECEGIVADAFDAGRRAAAKPTEEQ